MKIKLLFAWLLVFPIAACAFPPRDTGGVPDVRLNWTIPETRANGDPLPLAELKGYEIIYRRVGGSESDWVSILIAGGDITTATVSALADGEYEFAIAAIDTDDLYGEWSPANTNAVIQGRYGPLSPDLDIEDGRTARAEPIVLSFNRQMETGIPGHAPAS
jgi:hypothetical protein